MRLGAKIGLGIFILILCLLALSEIDTSTKTPPKVGDNNESDKLPYSPNLIQGSVGEKIMIDNFTIIVSPPNYTDIFYERCSGELFHDYYIKYDAKKGYKFTLIKFKVTNHGLEENVPYLLNFKVVTKKGLKYKEHSRFNYTREHPDSCPTPLLKDFRSHPPILPNEYREGYLYFQIPENALAKTLAFEYTGSSKTTTHIDVRIRL